MIYLDLIEENTILRRQLLGAQLKYKEEPLTFRRKQTHELNKLLKSLTAESQDAVDTLVKLLKSQDEKIQLQAASKIIEFMKDAANEVNKDQLQRLLLESKNPERQGNLIEDDNTPLVDFSNIQDV